MNGVATVYCRWINVGQFVQKAWNNVQLATMDVHASKEGFNVFPDSLQGNDMQHRFLYVVGDGVYFRTSVDMTIPAGTWHAGSVSFPVKAV